MGALVSVLIPTRERADTLRHSLRTVVEQSHRDLEIVVSDNASGPETRAVVDEIGDPRIRYVNTGKRVNMTDNFEFALSHATGDWVAVIGDDDGLLPTGIERALGALQATGLKALGSSLCLYRWPYDDDSGPEMFLTVPIGRGYEVTDARTLMLDVVDWKRSFITLPALYTGGVVARSVIDNIQSRGERFFNSRTPDVFSGFAVCSVVDRVVLMRDPIAIGGTSRHSHGWDLFGDPGQAFRSEGNMELHSSLVAGKDNLTPLLPTVIYEAYLQSGYLRSGSDPVSPRRQLALALMVAKNVCNANPAYADVVARWRDRFAARHDVSLSDIDGLVVAESMGSVALARDRLGRWLGYYRIDRAMKCDHRTVYDAAVLSERVRRTRPSRLRNYARSVRRRLRPVVGQSAK